MFVLKSLPVSVFSHSLNLTVFLSCHLFIHSVLPVLLPYSPLHSFLVTSLPPLVLLIPDCFYLFHLLAVGVHLRMLSSAPVLSPVLGVFVDVWIYFWFPDFGYLPAPACFELLTRFLDSCLPSHHVSLFNFLLFLNKHYKLYLLHLVSAFCVRSHFPLSVLCKTWQLVARSRYYRENK